MGEEGTVCKRALRSRGKDSIGDTAPWPLLDHPPLPSECPWDPRPPRPPQDEEAAPGGAGTWATEGRACPPALPLALSPACSPSCSAPRGGRVDTGTGLGVQPTRPAVRTDGQHLPAGPHPALAACFSPLLLCGASLAHSSWLPPPTAVWVAGPALQTFLPVSALTPGPPRTCGSTNKPSYFSTLSCRPLALLPAPALARDTPLAEVRGGIHVTHGCVDTDRPACSPRSALLPQGTRVPAGHVCQRGRGVGRWWVAPGTRCLTFSDSVWGGGSSQFECWESLTSAVWR